MVMGIRPLSPSTETLSTECKAEAPLASRLNPRAFTGCHAAVLRYTSSFVSFPGRGSKDPIAAMMWAEIAIFRALVGQRLSRSVICSSNPNPNLAPSTQ